MVPRNKKVNNGTLAFELEKLPKFEKNDTVDTVRKKMIETAKYAIKLVQENKNDKYYKSITKKFKNLFKTGLTDRFLKIMEAWDAPPQNSDESDKLEEFLEEQKELLGIFIEDLKANIEKNKKKDKHLAGMAMGNSVEFCGGLLEFLNNFIEYTEWPSDSGDPVLNEMKRENEEAKNKILFPESGDVDMPNEFEEEWGNTI